MRGARALDVSLGEHAVIHRNCIVVQTELLRYSYIASDCLVANAHIGSFCSIGPHTIIGLHRHPSKSFCTTHPAFFSPDNKGALKSFTSRVLFDESPKNTTIGHDVWIGANVIIPGGIIIGDGAIIAAGAVVTKSIAPYAIVGGNPARLINWRFEETVISELVKMAWWNWDISMLMEAAKSNAFENPAELKRFLESYQQ